MILPLLTLGIRLVSELDLDIAAHGAFEHCAEARMVSALTKRAGAVRRLPMEER